jgi:hypothetical protein
VLVGQTGQWRFDEKLIDASDSSVCSRKIRTGDFGPFLQFALLESNGQSHGRQRNVAASRESLAQDAGDGRSIFAIS